MPNTTFDQIKYAVLDYFNPSSDIWQKVNNGSATEAEILNAYSYIPQMQVIKSTDGSRILGIDYADPLLAKMSVVEDDIVESFNSNYSGSSNGYTNNGYTVNIPSNWSNNGGNLQTRGGATVNQTGATLATIADKVSLAVTGVNLGAKLGMKIDEGLYNLNPDFWNEHFPEINPATWAGLCGQSEIGDYFMRVLFGITEEGQTAYMTSESLAYTYQLMRDLGFFDIEGEGVNINTTVQQGTYNKNYPTHLEFIPPASLISLLVLSGNTYYFRRPKTGNFVVVPFYQTSNELYRLIAVSNAPFSVETVAADTGYVRWTDTSEAVTRNNQTYYYLSLTGFFDYQYGTVWKGYIPPKNTIPNLYQSYLGWDTGYLVYHGERYETSPIPGTSEIPNSTVPSPNIITGTTTADVLEQLKQNYPQLFDGAITSHVLQEDGTIRDDEYIPVPWATGENLTSTQPVTGDKQQNDLSIDEQTYTDIVTSDPTNNPPDTGTGNQSPYVAPTGSASSLWAVYHPSQAQLNAFGAWLWSSDFVEQLKRLFNDPMQAIIGVHKVFAPIPTGGSQNIKCGYLDSGVSSPIVTSQYTEVTCGTVNCREYFGNVFDYDPHTRVSIYLPFIGVVPLKVSEVMRASITVTYGVDVITGACLAKVKVDRDGGGAVLYSFGGSCACHYPISAGSYAGIISGIVTSAVGVAGGIMSGNPLAAVGGVLAGARQAHTEVQHSGGFTGCAGAMGPKIPYLIITRPQTRMANDVQLYEGKPSNATQFIGDCTGFVRATEVHFSSQAAFDDEAKEVEALLKSGVLIN